MHVKGHALLYSTNTWRVIRREEGHHHDVAMPICKAALVGYVAAASHIVSFLYKRDIFMSACGHDGTCHASKAVSYRNLFPFSSIVCSA